MSDKDKQNNIEIEVDALADIIFNSWLENQEVNLENYDEENNNK